MSKHHSSDTCMNGISFWRAYPRVRVASHGRHTGLPRPISYFQKSAKIFKCWKMLLFCFVRNKSHLSPTWLKRALNVNNFCALIGYMKRKHVVIIPLYFEKKSDPQPRYPISTLFPENKKPAHLIGHLAHCPPRPFSPHSWGASASTSTHVDATTHNHHVDATTFSDSLTFEPIFTFIAYSNPFPSLRS